jgi:hypothetical protein
MDNIRVAAIGLAGVVIGSVITASVQLLISSQQRDTKMVEIAIGVLAAKPDENVKGARSWATRVIERHSGTSFVEGERNELKGHALPYEPKFLPWSAEFSGKFAPLSGTDRYSPLPGTDRYSPLPGTDSPVPRTDAKKDDYYR